MSIILGKKSAYIVCVMALLLLAIGTRAADAVQQASTGSSKTKQIAATPTKPTAEKNQQSDIKPAEEKQLHFSVWEYLVKGNTLLPQELVEKTLAPFLGPDKDAGIINDAADALEHAYRKKGYPAVFVDVPQQNVIAGVVKLTVNESKISRLRITGSRYFTLSGLRKQVPSLRAGQTIYLPDVQRDIKHLHSFTTDLQAVPILKAGKVPGTMEVELRVKDKLPLHGSIETNNHYSANTTKERLEASIGYDNLWQKFHSFRLTEQVSPQNRNEVKVLVLNYIMPINDDKDRLAIYGVKSDSNIAAVGGLTVIGKGHIVGSRYVIPIEERRGVMQSVSLGLDYKNVEDIVGFQNSSSLKTPTRYVVAGTTYSATVYSKKSITSYDAAINFGIRGFNKVSEFDNKRFKANPDFIYFRGGITRTDILLDDFKLESSIKVQRTGSPLISNEQFTAGGFDTVRGYYESQILGDDGESGRLQIYSPKLFYKQNDTLDSRLIIFIDGAAVKTLDPLPGQDQHAQLLSFGMGLRVTKSKQLTIKLDWARPLQRAGDKASGNLVRKSENRAVFSLLYTF